MYMLRALFLLLIVAAVGCAPAGPPRYSISGKVTFQGESLKTGAIQFEPQDGKGQSGGAPIINGVFHVPQDKGMLAGNYRVLIYSGTTGVTPAEPPGPGVPVAAEHIPPRYNIQSTLSAAIGPDSDNTFDFKLD